MLDRAVVKDFLAENFKEMELVIPKDITLDKLVETFSDYTEDDYYEWLKDNFKSFFEHGSPDWDWIRGRIKHYDQL